MSGASYDKAVAGFEALVGASRAAHTKPPRLIQHSGQHLSSGYRHTATLEAEGFLRRDANGAYLPGTSCLRVALSAYGLGRLAPVVQPVLLHLREATQHTVFLAIVDQIDVRNGPFSSGRLSRHTKLCAAYRFELPRDLPAGQPTDVALVSAVSEPSTRVHTRMIPIQISPDHTATLGCVLNPTRAPDRAVSDALVTAAQQIAP